jgi:prepilin-type N-terminal cleavage/methylation domain-containing protein
MKCITSNLNKVRKAKANKLGFTLVELMISLALSAVILAAAAALLHYMVVTTGDNTDKTLAKMQLQYVSFWVGEDVAQAQSITLSNSTVDGYNVEGFPLVIQWIDPIRGYRTVTYQVDSMTDDFGRQLLKLNRYDSRTGNVTVAEYLVYEGSQYQGSNIINIAEREWAKCYQKEIVYDGEIEYMQDLVIEVTAWVDEQRERATFDIQPRMGNVTWTW